MVGEGGEGVVGEETVWWVRRGTGINDVDELTHM